MFLHCLRPDPEIVFALIPTSKTDAALCWLRTRVEGISYWLWPYGAHERKHIFLKKREVREKKERSKTLYLVNEPNG